MQSSHDFCVFLLPSHSKDTFHISQPAVPMYNCPLTSWDYVVQFKFKGV